MENSIKLYLSNRELERLKVLFADDDILNFVLKTQIEPISCPEFLRMEIFRILHLISLVKKADEIKESDALKIDLKIHQQSYPQLRIEFNKVIEKVMKLDMGEISQFISHQEIDRVNTAGDCLRLVSSKVTCKDS